MWADLRVMCFLVDIHRADADPRRMELLYTGYTEAKKAHGRMVHVAKKRAKRMKGSDH